MKIGVPKEIHAGERRVATTPDVASQLIEMGFSVAVEKDAGVAASCSDEAYTAAGCDIVATASDLWAQSDLILKVRAPASRSRLRRCRSRLPRRPGQNSSLPRQHLSQQRR